MPKKTCKTKGRKSKKGKKDKLKGKSRGNLPSKLMVFDSADKADHETWDCPPNRGMAQFPRPWRCINIAGVSCGKTSLTKNLIIHGDFDRIVLIHLDPDTQEYEDLDLPDEDIISEIPGIEFFDPPEPDDPNEEPKPWYTLVVMEDLDFDQNKYEKAAASKLFRYISTHRNVSCCLNFQNFTSLPPIVRRLSNIFDVYRMDDLVQADIVGRRIGLKKGVLQEMINQLCETRFDFITFDKTTGSPWPLRKNLFIPVKEQPVELDNIKDNNLESKMLQ